MGSSDWIATSFAVPLLGFVVWMLKKMQAQNAKIVDRYLDQMVHQVIVLEKVAAGLEIMHQDHLLQIQSLERLAVLIEKATKVGVSVQKEMNGGR